MKYSLLNLGLRGGGMVGKFLLIFFLARILPPEEIGIYGLFTVTLSYAMYFLGLDFYTYSGRAMLHAEKRMWPSMLRDQVVLFFCSYIVVFPVIALFFAYKIMPTEYALVFYILLTVEHLSQELTRLLVIIGNPLAAGVCLFVKSGAWCYVFVIISIGGLADGDLKSMFWLWSMADMLVLIGGSWMLRKLPWARLTWVVNWSWIYKGLQVAGVLLVGTLAVRGIFTVDRYFVKAFSDLEMLGVYTLYVGICFSIIGFIEASIFNFQYPTLVALHKAGDFDAFESVKRDFTRQTLLAVSLLALVAGVLIMPVLSWIGKDIYLQNLRAFFVLLAASVSYVIGYIPHYVLYAMGRDRSIVSAHIVGFFFFIVLNLLCTFRYGISGVSTSLLITIMIIGLLKQGRVFLLNRGG